MKTELWVAWTDFPTSWNYFQPADQPNRHSNNRKMLTSPCQNLFAVESAMCYIVLYPAVLFFMKSVDVNSFLECQDPKSVWISRCLRQRILTSSGGVPVCWKRVQGDPTLFLRNFLTAKLIKHCQFLGKRKQNHPSVILDIHIAAQMHVFWLRPSSSDCWTRIQTPKMAKTRSSLGSLQWEAKAHWRQQSEPYSRSTVCRQGLC